MTAAATSGGDLVLFLHSTIDYRGVSLAIARVPGRDLIVAPGEADEGALADAGLRGGERLGDYLAFPATYDNMLLWDGVLAPAPRLQALNRSGHGRGFGAGNRMVLARQDLPHLRHLATFAGWDGIFRAMLRSAAPFWFVQQSIVRELIPEGVSAADHPGIGHTGGYGPRELLRAGLFAFAGQGGYTRFDLPIGADADHAIVTGHDEESLEASLAFNKLAIAESADYTKFTVDTSHLFHFPVSLGQAERRRLLDAFGGRRFEVANILGDRPALTFSFDEDEIDRLGRKYWRACAVHKEIHDHVAAVRGARPFDYELSLDETPEATPPRELLFYLVLLREVMGLPGEVASAGPNLGFTKRHDFEGDLGWLRVQVNPCASILHHCGAMLSVHSADGVRAATGKGVGVDAVILEATAGLVELKVADVYQEVLWQVLERSPEPAEREIFLEAWRRTYEAARCLAAVYGGELAACPPAEAQRYLQGAGRERVARGHGEEALRLAQGAIGYGLPLFKLAADLLPSTDRERPSAESELFRRFMFLTYRDLRPRLFATLDAAGWERLAAAIDEATMIRLRAMDWLRPEDGR